MIMHSNQLSLVSVFVIMYSNTGETSAYKAEVVRIWYEMWLNALTCALMGEIEGQQGEGEYVDDRIL
jgi:hypothetical protein